MAAFIGLRALVSSRQARTRRSSRLLTQPLSRSIGIPLQPAIALRPGRKLHSKINL